MDTKKFGRLVGESLINGTQPTAEAVSSVLTDQELLEAVQARNLVLSPALGSIASEGVSIETPNEDAEVLSTPVTPESLAEQLTAAYKGYEATALLLNNSRMKRDQVEVADKENVAAELKAWITEDKLAYVAKAMEADPELRFTLVATPNVVAKSDEIIEMAREFGNNQPYATYVWSEIYGKYTPEQLSGTDPSNGNSVKFSLIPNKLDLAMQGTVPTQRTRLAQLQADSPFVGVPGVLEDITFWNTLRANGDSLATGDVFERTYVRHFDLPEKRLDAFLCVPVSFVNDDGEPYLGDSSVDGVYPARVSVG